MLRYSQFRARSKFCLRIQIRSSSRIVHGKKSWNVLFFGTDETSLHTLKQLRAEPDLIPKLEVVTPQPASGERSVSEVFEWCENEKVTAHVWTDKDFQMPEGFDIGVVASFGRFIPKQLINKLPYKMINMHPSLLPKYRGAAPVQHALLNHETETGVSIIDIHPTTMDAGDIWLQERFPVPYEWTARELLPFLANEGGRMVVQTLKDFDSLQKAKKPQGEEGVSQAPKLTAKDLIMDWSKYSANEIYGKFRAVPDKIYVDFLKDPYKLVKLHVIPDFTKSNVSHLEQLEPGQFVYFRRGKLIVVKCKDDTWIGITQIQKPTKPVWNCAQFMNHAKLPLTAGEPNPVQVFGAEIIES